MYLLSMTTPTSEGNTFWFLLLSFLFFLKYIYSISGCSEFAIIYYACFCKWGIWPLFPVLQLYLGFCKTNNGMWHLEVIYQFCHCCPCFYIIDLLNRFLLSELTPILYHSSILAEVAGTLGCQLLVFISAFLQWSGSIAGRLPNMEK